MKLKVNPWVKLSLYFAFIANYLFYPFDQGKKEIIYKVNDHTKFKIRVNSADKFSVLETWKLGSYSGKGFDIKPTDTVIDLGAHIGVFSIFAAQKASKGQVYSFEPDPENFRLLEENKTLNDLQNLHIFQKAVTGKQGKINLFVEHNIASINSIYENDNPMLKQSVKVAATTLEKIIEENKIDRVDFLKIDIEGAEYEVLFNTPASVFNKIRKISLEYHDYLSHGHNIKELEQFLQKKGFKTKIDNTLFVTRILKYGLIRAWKD